MATHGGGAPKLPSPRVAEQAQQALKGLAPLSARRSTRSFAVRPDEGGREVSVSVPREAFDLFLEVLGHLANGSAVTVVPIHAELTTQQAADLLNVSRPFLIGLLDEHKIPFRLVGSHRRLRMADLLAFKEADDKRRDEALDELAAEAQKHGLGY
jgi:excisionase family DNA binding protein